MSDYLRTYSEAMSFNNYDDRLEYLRLNDGNAISPRAMAMTLYKHRIWVKEVRPFIIERDLGFDLADPKVSIPDKIIVHHINPVSDADIDHWRDMLFDPENLICCSLVTHNYIHYGTQKEEYRERSQGDTKLW